MYVLVFQSELEALKHAVAEAMLLISETTKIYISFLNLTS